MKLLWILNYFYEYVFKRARLCIRANNCFRNIIALCTRELMTILTNIMNWYDYYKTMSSTYCIVPLLCWKKRADIRALNVTLILPYDVIKHSRNSLIKDWREVPRESRDTSYMFCLDVTLISLFILYGCLSRI